MSEVTPIQDNEVGFSVRAKLNAIISKSNTYELFDEFKLDYDETVNQIAQQTQDAFTNAQDAISKADELQSYQYLGVSGSDEVTASLELITYDSETGVGETSAILLNADNIFLNGSVGLPLLTVTELDGNLLPNGKFVYGDFRGWSAVTEGLTIASRDGDAVRDASPTPFMLQTPDSTDGHLGTAASDIPVKGGERFSAQIDVASSGATRNVIWRLIFRFTLSTGETEDFGRQAFTDSTTWATVELTEVIAPAGAEKLRVLVQRLEGGSGFGYATNISVRRKQNGSTIITPGGITTDLLAAGAVEAGKIKLNGTSLEGDGNGNLVVKNGGIITEKISPNAVSSQAYAEATSDYYISGGAQPDMITLTFVTQPGDVILIGASVLYNFLSSRPNEIESLIRIMVTASNRPDHETTLISNRVRKFGIGSSTGGSQTVQLQATFVTDAFETNVYLRCRNTSSNQCLALDRFLYCILLRR